MPKFFSEVEYRVGTRFEFDADSIDDAKAKLKEMEIVPGRAHPSMQIRDVFVEEPTQIREVDAPDLPLT